ncbi:MAG: efflux RND transporter periplasmic adaptor subunit [Bacteroidaceae bacterium]|nr:efflux RND transporter periplasmic adaptor subunit [Bacteroidaceae bacterium]
MKVVRTIFSLMTATMLVACGAKDEKTSVVPTVRVAEAEACGDAVSQQYPGKVVSADDANVSFKVAGTLRQINVKEGQHVRRGQLLAVMDDSDYKVQLKATEAEHAQIKAEAERVIGLYNEGGTTASNYDKARYGLEQIDAKLQHHTNQLSYTRIYAPYDGYVQKIYMGVGETVGAGMPVVGMLSSGTPEIEINLPASAYAQRDKFKSFKCSFDVLPNEVLDATPVSVLAQANSNQLYKMRLKLTVKNDAVSPGMSTWVTVAMNCKDATLVRVPTTSVLAENGKSYVFVYNSKQQTVKKVPVEVEEMHTDGTVEVRGAIKAQERVVSCGVHHVKDGMKVKLLQPVPKTNVGGLM